ncbi:hypothetical protein CNQ82_02020 [Staphylococcus debuckii]|nr:hypothetical protein CNQ82_02020 [Staphylococcus debuckii]
MFRMLLIDGLSKTDSATISAKRAETKEQFLLASPYCLESNRLLKHLFLIIGLQAARFSVISTQGEVNQRTVSSSCFLLLKS